MYFSLRNKILFLVVSASVISLLSLALMASRLFINDKKAYIYDYQVNILQSYAGQIESLLFVYTSEMNQFMKEYARNGADQGFKSQINFENKDLAALQILCPKSQLDNFKYISQDIVKMSGLDLSYFDLQFSQTESKLELIKSLGVYAEPLFNQNSLSLFKLSKYYSLGENDCYAISFLKSDKINEISNQKQALSLNIYTDEGTAFFDLKNQSITVHDLKAFQGLSGTQEVKDRGGQNFLRSFRKINDYRLVLLSSISVQDAYLAVYMLLEKTLYFTVFVILLVILVATLFSKTLTTPLAELVSATKRVGEGKLDINLKIRSKDEIGLLATSMNDMVKELRESKFDVLTGALTKKALREQVGILWSQSQETKQPLSLLFVDLDHFKKINDTLGHDAGDFVLQSLGKLILQYPAQKKIYFGRYGGEEFVVLAPNYNLQEACKLGEELRALIAAHGFVHNSHKIPVTASIGVAEKSETNQSISELFKAADEAVYFSKHNGRNRVSYNESGKCNPML